MPKVVFFLIAAGFVILGSWLLAGIPGHFSASIGSYSIDTSAPIAIVMSIVLVAAILIVLRVAGSIAAIPRSGAAWRRRSRRAAGETAITRVLVALAAGEQGPAWKEARRARLLLGDSPQTLLLVAEAARLAGREDEAGEAFQVLAKHPGARFLGLRGLLRQAVDRRDWPGALIVAREAEAAHPGTAWLRQQRADLAIQTGNWADAVEFIGPDARRLTYCVAAADAEPDPGRSIGFAKQAWKQDPTFPPAVIAYASRLRARGHERRAQACIAAAWKRAPHPDLAVFALAPQTTPLARHQAGKRLAGINPSHPESRILMARVSLDAGFTGEARHQIEIAEAEGVKQQRRLCLLLAEIEEHDRGDTEAGRIAQRDALRRAASADPDPHWQCTNCRIDHALWLPKCETCGEVGTIQWQTGARTPGLAIIAA